MRSTSIFISLLFACVACSKGGSGSSTPQPPQVVTPPPNNDPSLEIAAIPTALDEFQSFSLDASASSDPDGDALTFQIEFSPSEFASVTDISTAPVWIVETSSVDQDETVSITVTVSDGSASVSETVEFMLSNYDRAPLTTKWGSASDSFSDSSVSDRNLGWSNPFDISSDLYTLVRSEDNSGRIEQFSFSDEAFATPTGIELDIELTGQEVFYQFPLDFMLNPDFVVHDPNSGRVSIFRREADNEVSNAGQFTILDSCSIGATQVGDAPQTFPTNEPYGLIVGGPNGLTALLNNGSPVPAGQPSPQTGTFSESRIIATTGRFCELDFNQFNTNENARFFDADRAELVPIFSALGSSAQLQTPIDVNMPSEMTLVDIAGGYMSFGSYFSVLLFAGETHTSDHQLTIVHQYFGSPVEQIDIALPHGIPSHLYVAPIDGTGLASDIIVTAPETPYIYVFENISPFSIAQFAPVEYLDVGFGVKQVDQILAMGGATTYYLVTNDGETLTGYPSIP